MQFVDRNFNCCHLNLYLSLNKKKIDLDKRERERERDHDDVDLLGWHTLYAMHAYFSVTSRPVSDLTWSDYTSVSQSVAAVS